MIRHITTKDRINFHDYCLKENKHQELFIVQNGEKVLLDNHKLIDHVFNKIVKGNFEGFVVDSKEVKGILIISKDNGNNYISLKTINLKNANHLFKFLFWNTNYKELNMIVNKDNRLKFVAKTYHFNFDKKIDDNLHLKFIRK